MMFGVRKSPTGNFVHNDEIWKDHVHRELQTSRKWPNTWGFLAAHYQGKGTQPRPLSINPTALVVLPPIPQPYCELAQEIPRHTRDPQSSMQTQSSTGYPQTTAAEVGWRASEIGRLEKYGRHARGQRGIRKLLNWPRETIL